jgi:hypothetical protein
MDDDRQKEQEGTIRRLRTRIQTNVGGRVYAIRGEEDEDISEMYGHERDLIRSWPDEIASESKSLRGRLLLIELAS